MDRHLSNLLRSSLLLSLLIFYPLGSHGMSGFPLAPPDRSTPWDTLNSFVFNISRGKQLVMEARDIWNRSTSISAADGEAKDRIQLAVAHFDRAKKCFDMSQVPSVIREETSWQAILLLKEILDRVGIHPVDPGTEDLNLSRWTIPETEIQLSRIESGVNQGLWLISSESISRLKGDYNQVKHMAYLPGLSVKEGFYEEYLVTPGRSLGPWMALVPQWSKRNIYGQALWQWIALAFSFAVFALAIFGAWRLAALLEAGDKVVLARAARIFPPVMLSLGAAWQISFVDHYVNISGYFCLVVINFLTLIRWTGWSLAIFRVMDLISEVVILSPRIDPGGIDASLVRTLSHLLSIMAAATILTYGASEMGFSLPAIITGLGIAGLAVSLAARPTIENIIGGLSLFADRSIKVGEFCRFGDTAGTVIGIGLRSTRIQGLDHTEISIPNSMLSQMQIVNVTRRPDSLMEKRISLRYETTEEQLRGVLKSVGELLENHPMVCSDPAPFVRLESLADWSIDILIFAYLRTKKWSERTEIEEDILLQTRKIVQEWGARFAFPSTTAYVAVDGTTEDLGESRWPW